MHFEYNWEHTRTEAPCHPGNCVSEQKASDPHLTPVGPAPSGPLGISRTGVGEAEGLRNLAIAVKAALSTGRARQAADDAPGQDPLPSEADTSARLFANIFVSEPTISEPDNAATHID